MTTAIICIFIAGYVLIAMENWTLVNKSAVAVSSNFASADFRKIKTYNFQKS